jgi:hypothetical protein
MRALSQLDLAFCIDLTASMSGFIASAKRHMVQVLDAFAAQLHGGLRVAIVGYRDHCDGKKLLEVHPLEADLARVANTIASLAVSGGGDAPEAVYTGLEACLGLGWTAGSYRVILLVGDAPPHGVGAPGDSLARDPTGHDLDGMANKLETEGVFVHALSMQPADQHLATAFRRLSISTGGGYYDTATSTAIAIVEAVAHSLLQHIELDTQLYARLRDGVPVPEDELGPSRAQLLAKQLGREELEIHTGMMRLRRRRLIEL